MREMPLTEASTIGLDIAKHVFHASSADRAWRALLSRRLPRGKLLAFFGGEPRSLIAAG